MQEVLKQFDIFSGLSSESLDDFVRSMVLGKYSPGEMIVMEGDPEEAVYFITSGAVRVFKTNLEGREQTLIHLGMGEIFNLPTAFTTSHDTPASAVAIDDASALRIAQEDLRRLVVQSPEIALAVLGNLSEKLHHLTGLVHDVSLRSVRGRLAGFLVKQSRGEIAGKNKWTQEQIATHIGTTREVVSRALRAFIRDGLIKRERQRISVIDVERLSQEIEK